MIDQVFKLAAAAGAAAAAWYADKYVKEKTGKHIHEHAVDYVKALWTRLKDWASKYLAEHERIRKVYLSAVSIAAAAKRARDAGQKFVRIKIFGQPIDNPTPKVIREEEVDLSQIDGFLQQAKTEPVLAMRY
jgi:MoxR-like ATPase